jgi:23S rRNA (cytidine1920-2'-O)/16S rRNA (cytidine1409-2'-O)-methyltransferase
VLRPMVIHKEGAKKVRLDALLFERGLIESIVRAQALIMSGNVLSGTKRLDKPGEQVASDIPITVRSKGHPWVSRGGIKLAHGLDYFQVNVQGKHCLDIGASTGGFTDVLLAGKASHIVAVDVGHGQFDWKLRNNINVTLLERTNARYLTSELIPKAPDIVVCDASFIGLQTVLPAAMDLASSGASLIALIKPQFEAAKELVGKRGVVWDAKVHEKVCNQIRDWISTLPNWKFLEICESPILGPEGNKEFFLAAKKNRSI